MNKKEPSEADLEALRKIKQIIAKGDDAEVRLAKDGSLKVFRVRKEIA